MMLIEAEGKVGAEKGKHSKDRKTYFLGGLGAADGPAAGDLLSHGIFGRLEVGPLYQA
jgi:hypothetical protein